MSEQQHATNERFIHCGQCLAQKPSNKSASEYSQLEVLVNACGLHIRCKRHNKLVGTFDAIQLAEWMQALPACDQCDCPDCNDGEGQ